MTLEANMKIVREEHLDFLFRWDKCVNGEFWTNEEQVLSEIAKIKGGTAKRNALKEKIADYAKGLG